MLDQDFQYRDEVSGCTASVALITKSKIYVVSVETLTARIL